MSFQYQNSCFSLREWVERWEWMKVMIFRLDKQGGSLLPLEHCALTAALYSLPWPNSQSSISSILFPHKTSTESNMTAQYPLGAVKSPLPDFRIGPYKTESHALHDKSIMGRVIEWTSFETEAIPLCRQTEWNATKRVIAYHTNWAPISLNLTNPTNNLFVEMRSGCKVASITMWDKSWLVFAMQWVWLCGWDAGCELQRKEQRIPGETRGIDNCIQPTS